MKLLTNKQFKEKMKVVWGNELDYSGSVYINSRTKVVVLDLDDVKYLSKPNIFLQGKRPVITSAINIKEAMLIKAKLVHPNYNFEILTVGYNGKILVNCGSHKSYITNYQTLVYSGYKCRLCVAEDRPGCYASVYKYDPEQKTGIYLFECSDENEFFYKVGLSINPKDRSWHIPYKVNILGYAKGTVKELFPLEQSYHKIFYNNKYIPNKKFDGYTECFKIN